MDGLPVVSGILAPSAVEAYGGGEVVPAVTAKWSKGCGGPAGDETQNLVAYPILEVGKTWPK